MNWEFVNWEIFFDIHKDLPRQGCGRDRYTKKAFDMISPIKQPLILDVGCGPGLQTIKLAKLSDGKIIAIYNHQAYLDQLKQTAKKEHLSDRIEILNNPCLIWISQMNILILYGLKNRFLS